MRGSRTLLIIAGAICVPLCLAGQVAAPTGQTAQYEDPYKDSVVLLELLVVEAQTSELHDLGVTTFSAGPKSIKVDNILKCLEAKAAAIKASITLEVGNKERAKTDSIVRQGFYTGRSNPTLEYADFGPSLVAEAQVLSRTKVSVEVTFKHSVLVEDKPYAEKGCPAIIEKNWYGRVSLTAGEPTLIGAAQSEETVSFLLVTAHIK